MGAHRGGQDNDLGDVGPVPEGVIRSLFVGLHHLLGDTRAFVLDHVIALGPQLQEDLVVPIQV